MVAPSPPVTRREVPEPTAPPAALTSGEGPQIIEHALVGGRTDAADRGAGRNGHGPGCRRVNPCRWRNRSTAAGTVEAFARSREGPRGSGPTSPLGQADRRTTNLQFVSIARSRVLHQHPRRVDADGRSLRRPSARSARTPRQDPVMHGPRRRTGRRRVQLVGAMAEGSSASRSRGGEDQVRTAQSAGRAADGTDRPSSNRPRLSMPYTPISRTFTAPSTAVDSVAPISRTSASPAAPVPG